MGLLTEIKNAEHSFAAFAEKEWVKLYNETPKLEQIVSTTLKYVGPALQMIVTAEAGAPAGALVGSVIKEAQSDLLAASSLIYDFGATPSVSSVFTGVNTDLSSLLTAGHVTDPKSVSAVNRVISEVEVLAAAIKNAIVPGPPTVAAPAITPRA